MTGMDAIQIYLQLLFIASNLIIAFVMMLSVMEIRDDRKMAYLEKRLEEFYIPLINLFSHGNLKRDYNIHVKVEEIVVSKGHLCGKKVAAILPPHFTATIKSNGDFYFNFDKEELKHWIGVADAIWEEYIEVLRKHYRIIGVKHYTLPEKPKWMFKEWNIHELK